jgi:RimJ/RimL family protein N-acetyltransferase
MKTLLTQRLTLEPLTERHASALFPGFSDPELYRYIPQEPPASVAALRDRFRVLEKRASPDGTEVWLNWALRLSKQSQYVGLVEATVIDVSAQLAYFVFRSYSGHGFATEGCAAVLAHLFGQWGTATVTATIDSRNTASSAVAASLGFVRSGFQRNADHFKGMPSDEITYILRESMLKHPGPHDPQGGSPRRAQRTPR